MAKLTLSDLSLPNERVLMRVDFNVPLRDDGTIASDARIVAALPSIRYVLDRGASLVLMSHQGRPEGKRDPRFSLAPCAKRLSQLLNKPVLFAPDCIGSDAEEMAFSLSAGSILLLENLRFHPGEEHPEQELDFCERLSRLGTVYVNDAFGTAHRAHASTALITRYFPGTSAMGLLIEKELSFLEPLLKSPKRPFFMLVGGAKVASKAGLLKRLLPKLDALFIGGAMAFPFLKAGGLSVGASLCDPKDVAAAKEILPVAHSLHLPSDAVAAPPSGKPAPHPFPLPEGWKGMDIGPDTVEHWTEHLKQAATVFWNGPLGVFEEPPFDAGTRAIAEALAKTQAKVIIGGGDSVAAIEQMGLKDRFAHLSTGGGASLEFLEFGSLPGINALSDKI